MSVVVIPITTESPPTAPVALSPGHILSGRERGAVYFRDKLQREMTGPGPKRTSDHLAGYRAGWDAAVDFLRAAGALR